MEEKFYIIRKKSSREINRCSFSKKQMALIAEGLNYASVRDSISERRTMYTEIKKEIYRMMRTRAKR